MTLPIEEALPALREALAASASVVLQAPPGAGKSTGVPLALLRESWLGRQQIVMLEPRRLAARAVATRMAYLLGEPVGRTVGYRTRLDTRVSAQTVIEVVTEGILTRWLQRDPALEGVALVIFDEFHERSLNADLGLALALDAQAALREDLKLLVMSATLDGEAVARLLGEAPVVTSAGLAFPVETRWADAEVEKRSAVRGLRPEQRAEQRAVATILRALDVDPGDMLVFLPGQGEIRRVQQALEGAALPRDVRIAPLYGELTGDEQDAAIRPSRPGERKIVLATNIAETSLTIEGARIVIDSGLARRARFDPATGMSRLEVVRISRASADQRRGRAGRLASGVCYRLWTEGEHASLAAQTPAEIVEADLAPLALELASWGVSDPSTLRWLDPPPKATFSQARDLLHSLEALDAQGRITEHGRSLVRLPMHPRLAHMLMRAGDSTAQRTAIEIAAVLGERDLLRFEGFERNADLRLRIEALRGHAAPAGARIDSGARQRAQRVVEQLSRQLEVVAHTRADDDRLGSLLALAYPDRIAQSRGGGRYVLSNGRGAQVQGVQSLSQCEYLVVADLDARERDAQIRLAAPLTLTELEHTFANQIEARTRIEWDAREQAVAAQRERWFGALQLSARRIDQADGAQVLNAMLSGVREMGLAALPWTKEARALQARMMFAQSLGLRAPAAWPQVADEALLASLEDWLAPYLAGMTRRDHLSRLDLHGILWSMLDWNMQQRLNEAAPTHLAVPSGSRIPIDYAQPEPIVAVRLQEVFGLRATPTVGDGRVPLTLHLLSPAHRPVQVTRDLTSFWSRGYADVKKELKGRYPKHYWPDDPLTATATARAKPRS